MIKQLADIVSVNLFKHIGIPKVAPRVLNIISTYLCDSRCKTCNIWKIYREDKRKLNQELKTEELKRIIKEADNLGVRYVSITGGEPFLRQDIVEILSIIGNNFKISGIVTNGLASNQICNKVKNILSNTPSSHFFTVAVSLDGLEQKHDFLRGIHGAFQKAIKTLKLLNKLQKDYSNLNIDVSFTLTNENYEDLKPTLSYLLDEKLIPHPSHFSFRYAQQTILTNSPGGAANRKKVIDSIKDLQRAYPYFKNKFVNGIIEYIKSPSKLICPCYALFSSIWIDPYGNVFPCVPLMQEGFIGNLRLSHFDLREIWFSEQANRLRKKIKKGICPNCWVECQSVENMKYSIYKPSNLWYMVSRYMYHKKFF